MVLPANNKYIIKSSNDWIRISRINKSIDNSGSCFFFFSFSNSYELFIKQSLVNSSSCNKSIFAFSKSSSSEDITFTNLADKMKHLKESIE